MAGSIGATCGDRDRAAWPLYSRRSARPLNSRPWVPASQVGGPARRGDEKREREEKRTGDQLAWEIRGWSLTHLSLIKRVTGFEAAPGSAEKGGMGGGALARSPDPAYALRCLHCRWHSQAIYPAPTHTPSSPANLSTPHLNCLAPVSRPCWGGVVVGGGQVRSPPPSSLTNLQESPPRSSFTFLRIIASH